MAVEITHAFTSAKADGTDATLVQPSNWNEAHDFTMATSRILGRVTGGAGSVEELTSADIWTVLGFVAGTALLFNQTSPPTGWTKQVVHNDKALRLVSGTVSSGGSSAFSTVFGKTATDGHALTSAENGPHTHDSGPDALASDNLDNVDTLVESVSTNTGSRPCGSGCNYISSVSENYAESDQVTISNTDVTGSSGSSGSGTAHTHPMDIRVQYVDVIIATKD